MQVRLALNEDAPIIASNNIALAKESENHSLDPEIALKGVMILLNQAEKGFYLVAEQQENVVGQVMVTFEWSDWRARNIWWLQSIYVTPQYRRQGVMRTLISAVSSMAAKQDVLELKLYVHVDNHSAIKAYQHIPLQKLPYTLFGLSMTVNQ